MCTLQDEVRGVKLMADMVELAAAAVHAGWAYEGELVHDKVRCKQECDTFCSDLTINPVSWRIAEAYSDPTIAGEGHTMKRMDLNDPGFAVRA